MKYSANKQIKSNQWLYQTVKLAKGLTFFESSVIAGWKVMSFETESLQVTNGKLLQLQCKVWIRWDLTSNSFNLSNFVSLIQIIDSVEERLNLQISSGKYKIDHSLEKKAARHLFRSHGLLEISKKADLSLMPNIHYDINPFNSILRCQLLAETNQKFFYEGVIKTGQATVSSYISLFKSDNEEELINNWGITQLRSATRAMTKFLPKDLSKEIHLELKSSDK